MWECEGNGDKREREKRTLNYYQEGFFLVVAASSRDI